jgi:hypothetical protein
MPDLPADGLGREIQLLGCAADTTKAGNHPEVLKVFDIHADISEISETLFTRIRLYQSGHPLYREDVLLTNGAVNEN